MRPLVDREILPGRGVIPGLLGLGRIGAQSCRIRGRVTGVASEVPLERLAPAEQARRHSARRRRIAGGIATAGVSATRIAAAGVTTARITAARISTTRVAAAHVVAGLAGAARHREASGQSHASEAGRQSIRHAHQALRENHRCGVHQAGRTLGGDPHDSCSAHRRRCLGELLRSAGRPGVVLAVDDE